MNELSKLASGNLPPGLASMIPGLSSGKDANCIAVSEKVPGYFPSTYDRTEIINRAQLYVDDKMQRIMCKNADAISPLLVNIVTNSIEQYLKNAPPDSELYTTLKNTYIDCIKEYCDQIPDNMKLRLVQKYMLKIKDSFSNILPISLEFEEFQTSNDPFTNLPFVYENEPSQTPPPVLFDSKKALNPPPLLDIQFNQDSYQSDMLQAVAVLKPVIGTVGYSSKGAYLKVVYESLKEIFETACADHSNLKKMYVIIDDAVNRYTRAISSQLEKNDLSNVICMYLLTTNNTVSSIVRESFDTMKWIISKHKTLEDVTKLAGFLVYHSINHRLDPSLQQSDLVSLFTKYASQFGIQWKRNNWFRSNEHPFLAILRAKQGEPYLESIMKNASKAYVPYGIVNYVMGKRGGTRKRKPTRKSGKPKPRRVTRKRGRTRRR